MTTTTQADLAENSSPQALAAWLDTSPRTLADWRGRGTGPRYVKVGKLIRYRRADVLDWLDAARVA